MIEKINKHLGMPGQMISASKSTYKRDNPDNTVFFNACIFDSAGNQVWWGDLDLTAGADDIKALSDEVNETFYITPEHPFRTDLNTVTLEQLQSSDRVRVYEKVLG